VDDVRYDYSPVSVVLLHNLGLYELCLKIRSVPPKSLTLELHPKPLMSINIPFYLRFIYPLRGESRQPKRNKNEIYQAYTHLSYLYLVRVIQ
jgi:hypothetical protein